jgi:hypothetical protein
MPEQSVVHNTINQLATSAPDEVKLYLNESALCYRRMCMYIYMSGCNEMYCDETTKGEKLQTFPLAQLDLLTTEIVDLPSDTKKVRHFGRRWLS